MPVMGNDEYNELKRAHGRALVLVRAWSRASGLRPVDVLDAVDDVVKGKLSPEEFAVQRGTYELRGIGKNRRRRPVPDD